GSNSACSHSIHEAIDEGALETSSIRNDNDSTAPSTVATEVASGCPECGPTTVAVSLAGTATCGTASPLGNPSTTACLTSQQTWRSGQHRLPLCSGPDRVSARRGVVTVIVRKRRREDHWRWSALSRYSSGSSTLWSSS